MTKSTVQKASSGIRLASICLGLCLIPLSNIADGSTLPPSSARLAQDFRRDSVSPNRIRLAQHIRRDYERDRRREQEGRDRREREEREERERDRDQWEQLDA